VYAFAVCGLASIKVHKTCRSYQCTIETNPDWEERKNRNADIGDEIESCITTLNKTCGDFEGKYGKKVIDRLHTRLWFGF